MEVGIESDQMEVNEPPGWRHSTITAVYCCTHSISPGEVMAMMMIGSFLFYQFEILLSCCEVVIRTFLYSIEFSTG